MNKKYNNPLATGMGQGIKSKIQSRLTYTTLPQSTSGRRSMKATTRGLSLSEEKGPYWQAPRQQ
jgi:hypothetical protein